MRQSALILLTLCRASAILGPVGLRTGDTYFVGWSCKSGSYVQSIGWTRGSRFGPSFAMQCSSGESASFNTPALYNGFGQGIYALTVHYDACSVCDATYYYIQTGYTSDRVGSGCGSACASETSVTLSCDAGQIVTGFTGNGQSNDGVYQLGILCGPHQCGGYEKQASFCICSQPNQYQSGVNCVPCVDSCAVGYYLSGCGGSSVGSCFPCTNAATGVYYTGNGNLNNACPTTACANCPAGQQRSGCGGLSPGSCVACANPTANGYYYQSGCSVVGCPAGTYAAGPASTSCGSCPANAYSPSQSSACTCNAGFYGDGSQCARCPAGFACVSGGATPCAIGQYSTQGSITCAQCAAGTYSGVIAASACTLCAAGSYSLALADSCSICGPATFSLRGAAACSPCKAGTYSNAYNVSACAACVPGTYSLDGAVACSACGKGLYNTATGASSPNLCAACPPGTYGALVGATTCLSCPPGTASNSYGTMEACGACLPGTFAPANGSRTCTACANPQCGAGAGLIPCTSTTDAVCGRCPIIAMCVYTSAGCVLADGTPACACPQGYQLTAGACGLCPQGQFKPFNNTARCAPWTVVTCPAAMFLANGTPYQDSQCIACPPLPANAVRPSSAVGCAWGCAAGFNNNAI